MSIPDRMAYLAQCERGFAAAVPRPSPQPAVPGHEAEILASHEGRSTVAQRSLGERVFAAQDRQHAAGDPVQVISPDVAAPRRSLLGRVLGRLRRPVSQERPRRA